jgi:hypothetical protein
MGALGIPDLLSLAAGAGFSGGDLDTAVAIALAESGGVPTAYNTEPGAKGGTPAGQGSYGLWQIYAKLHPEFDVSQLFDPSYNASAAYSIYVNAGMSFIPWSTYKFGQYLGFLSAVQAADPGTAAASDGSSDGSSSGNGGLTLDALTIPLVIGGAGLFLLLFLRG